MNDWKPPRFYIPIGICGCCRRFKLDIKWRRRNTCYHDDKSNWLLACSGCQEQDDKYYQELWDEYNAGRL